MTGKYVLITGSNRGLGKAIMQELASSGMNIWAHARKETPEFLQLMNEIKHGKDILNYEKNKYLAFILANLSAFFDISDAKKKNFEFIQEFKIFFTIFILKLQFIIVIFKWQIVVIKTKIDIFNI